MDFGRDPQTEEFFAFPEHRFWYWAEKTQFQDWDKNIILAEYEVEDALVSDWQVMFHKDKAKFLCEIPLADFIN